MLLQGAVEVQAQQLLRGALSVVALSCWFQAARAIALLLAACCCSLWLLFCERSVLSSFANRRTWQSLCLTAFDAMHGHQGSDGGQCGGGWTQAPSQQPQQQQQQQAFGGGSSLPMPGGVSRAAGGGGGVNRPHPQAPRSPGQLQSYGQPQQQNSYGAYAQVR